MCISNNGFIFYFFLFKSVLEIFEKILIISKEKKQIYEINN